MGMGRVPLYRSLTFRLLAASLTIAATAVVATAWLASQTTSQTIQRQLGQSLSEDKSVYDELLGYSATHRDWSGVSPLVTSQAEKLDRRITLMTEDRQVLADSMTGPSLATARPSAIVDPLSADLELTGRTDRIDSRIVGPFALSASEQSTMRDELAQALECLRNFGSEGHIVTGPHNRPKVVVTLIGKQTDTCQLVPSAAVSEQRPLAALRDLIAACAGEKNLDNLAIAPDLSVNVFDPLVGVPDPERQKKAAACLDEARRTQLKPWVAPPALLFITDSANPGDQPRTFPLSRENLLRTGTATAVVLVLALLVTILVGRRLTHPLRALTEAARHPGAHPRVQVTGHDEIGYLAAALNELAERREQSEQLRKAMVNDVAHELRNPLTTIRTWLEAVRDGIATVDGPLLALLHHETTHLQHIIDDLRDLAAADAGTLRMHPEPSYINDAIDQVIDAHLPHATTAGVHLAAEHDGDPEIVVDPVRLRQLVGNLLTNAIRHSRPAGTVTIRSRDTDGLLTITVTDTGTGIAPDDLPKIFDRFWRADESRSRSTGGSGLGLPIARQIATAHGGDITVTSTPGAGTTFTVTLPATRVPTATADIDALDGRIRSDGN